MNELDEPRDLHPFGCAVWTSNDPCDCRDALDRAPLEFGPYLDAGTVVRFGPRQAAS